MLLVLVRGGHKWCTYEKEEKKGVLGTETNTSTKCIGCKSTMIITEENKQLKNFLEETNDQQSK